MTGKRISASKDDISSFKSKNSYLQSNVEWFIDTIEIGDVKLPELQNKVQGMRYKKQKWYNGHQIKHINKSFSYVFNQS